MQYRPVAPHTSTYKCYQYSQKRHDTPKQNENQAIRSSHKLLEDNLVLKYIKEMNFTSFLRFSVTSYLHYICISFDCKFLHPPSHPGKPPVAFANCVFSFTRATSRGLADVQSTGNVIYIRQDLETSLTHYAINNGGYLRRLTRNYKSNRSKPVALAQSVQRTGYTLNARGVAVLFPSGARYLSLLHDVQMSSDDHPTDGIKHRPRRISG